MERASRRSAASLVGSRELLLNGHDPYSEQVSEKIQIALARHKYDPRRDAVEQRFYYPVYIVFLMAPTVHLPFPAVKASFAALLLILAAASVPLWVDFLEWRIAHLHQASLIVLSLCSMAALQGLYLQNLGLLVSALIAGACFAIRRGWFLMAGPLLAFATIKPQLVAPLVVCLFIWSLGAFAERRKLVWSLRATRPRPAAFPGCLALVLLVFFCVNKQAFVNYYFLVIGAALLAAVMADLPPILIPAPNCSRAVSDLDVTVS